jgi:hypothetical protein
MYTLMTLGMVAVFPVVCMGGLLLLGRLEETLEADLRHGVRHRTPQPIRSVPVREPTAARPRAPQPVTPPAVTARTTARTTARPVTVHTVSGADPVPAQRSAPSSEQIRVATS